jgi:hypothetical protein
MSGLCYVVRPAQLDGEAGRPYFTRWNANCGRREWQRSDSSQNSIPFMSML